VTVTADAAACATGAGAATAGCATGGGAEDAGLVAAAAVAGTAWLIGAGLLTT
jgi:hypothetical protein